MNTIQAYFDQSQLALAAYGNLQPGAINPADLINPSVGMSADQADHFASTYSVAAQYNDPNGLSATVFADATGNTYLAIRGTDSAIDMITNVIDIEEGQRGQARIILMPGQRREAKPPRRHNRRNKESWKYDA